jgi:putative two-component system response regulator
LIAELNTDLAEAEKPPARQPEEGTRKPTVLVVDDAPENIAALAAVLKGDYRARAATDGKKALELARTDSDVDLILLDVVMPGMDGYEVCRQLKRDPKTADVPVIFLTARGNTEDEQRGLELGAVDYIMKPFSPPIVKARLKTHLQLKKARDFLVDKSAFLEDEVQRRTREVHVVQDVTMMAMGSLAETRDNETGNHIRRTQYYMEALALQMNDLPRFSDFLTPETIDLLVKSAPLHDIGKVGIPDRILLKPGKLLPEEFAIMKTHTTIGRDAILAAEIRLDASTSFLRHARETAYSHHEKWDGSGYPSGLSGDEIPVSARLMAVADVYDALTSKRVYKEALSHEKAVSIIHEGSGTHFDPDAVSAFLEIQDQFHTIAQEYADEGRATQ